MKTFIYKRRYPVQLITKRSNGDCFVIRQIASKTKLSYGRPHIYTRRFWCPRIDLEQPVKATPKPKNRPGVKTRPQPIVKKKGRK